MGVMITTGLVTAVAAIVLLAVSSAVQGRPLGSIVDDIAAERIERRVADLVADGARRGRAPLVDPRQRPPRPAPLVD